MKNFLLLFLFFCLVCELKAQTNYRPGYIITLQGDTVYGQIDYRGDDTMGRICRFKSGNDVKTEYFPGEIQAYRFTDSKYYVSYTINNRPHFLEFLIKGKMNIYYLRNNEGDHYYIEKENEPLRLIPYSQGIRRKEKDGADYFYQSTRHIGLLNYETAEAPQLQKEISKIKEPGHQNLIRLAKDYHKATCSESEPCLVFERPLPLIKVQIEPFAGGYLPLKQWDDIERINFSSVSPAIGANIYLWFPRSNENWYFHTGIMALDHHLFVFPIQFSYVYPSGKIRPTFSAGISYYVLRTSRTTVLQPVSSYSAGLLKPFNSKNSLSFTLGLDMIPPEWDEIPIVFLPSTKLLGLTATIGFRRTL
ncbi:MAG: hypothetical protein LBN18_00875 [Dysgonamonadaceae bacterium]|jgi:hypothetical protein|nr:hypothetical protein [Dysgonamonadaceae bacterium]